MREELLSRNVAKLVRVPPPPGYRVGKGLAVDQVRKSSDSRLHDLRHTVVSLLMELGVPPHIVQAIARHADVKITLKIYSHANLDVMRQALGKLDGRPWWASLLSPPRGMIFPGRFALVLDGGHGRFRTCDPSLLRRFRQESQRPLTSTAFGP